MFENRLIPPATSLETKQNRKNIVFFSKQNSTKISSYFKTRIQYKIIALPLLYQRTKKENTSPSYHIPNNIRISFTIGQTRNKIITSKIGTFKGKTAENSHYTKIHAKRGSGFPHLGRKTKLPKFIIEPFVLVRSHISALYSGTYLHLRSREALF